MEEHNKRNFGDEEEWLRHMYEYLSEYKDNNYDLESL